MSKRDELLNQNIALKDENARLRAEVERLTQMVSPRYSIPIEEALGPLKPCPFCGSHNIGSHEGGVYCNRCDATNSTLSWQMRPPSDPTVNESLTVDERNKRRLDDCLDVANGKLRAKVAELEAAIIDWYAWFTNEDSSVELLCRLKAIAQALRGGVGP